MKILLTLFFTLNLLFAQITICYKEGVSPTQDINVLTLDGGECGGNKTISEMKNDGWGISDQFKDETDTGINYTYSFSKSIPIKETPKNITSTSEQEKEIKQKGINLSPINLTLSNVTQKTATIPMGNLAIGQSGIIIHNFSDKNEMILAQGIVASSNETTSEILFVFDDIIKQDAIPTTNLKPQNGDTFILNHLYDTALLITPNFEIHDKITRAFYNLHFINEDVFAGYLKIIENPTPKIEDFVQFSKINNIGLLLIVVNKKLYILDINSQEKIHTLDLAYQDTTTTLPFFTNIEGITTGTFDFFTKESIEDYHKYYTNLLGLNNDR